MAFKDGSGTDCHELYARVSVVERQLIDQRDAIAIALSAAEKNTEIAHKTADKAMTRAESAVDKSALQASVDALREIFLKQIESSDKAVQKAEAATEKRFESVNEFRATLSDQQRDLATKSEVDLRFRGLEGRVNTVVEDARESKGLFTGAKTTKEDNRGLVFGIIGIVIALSAVIVAIFGHFMK